MTALGGGLLTPNASAATTSSLSADYNAGYSLGLQAYEYGRPLLDTQRVFDTETSVNISDDSGDGPVNHFNNLTHLATPSANQQTVVAPNDDTLYSLAWLDLSSQPQIVHVPKIQGRFFALGLLTPWTENFYNITSLEGPTTAGSYGVTSGGDYAVVPPGWHGTLPAGVTRIDAPYDRVWIIGRTLIRGEADRAAVNAIQAQYSVVPLSKYGTDYQAPVPTEPVTSVTSATIPGTQPGDDPLAFYTALDKELAIFPPPTQDAPLLTKLHAIDVGAGLNPATDKKLSAQTLQGMRDAVTDGPSKVASALKTLYMTNSLSHNGSMVVATGNYGTDYQLRAIVDKVGLGALRPDISIYPITQTTQLLQTLKGAHKYVLHIAAGQTPPGTGGFWSVTMYDQNGFFVPNTLDRYVLNDRSDFHKNTDGSIDIYIQTAAPKNPAQLQNWLPAPAGTFHVIWRLYGPGSAMASILNGHGWRPPAIQECVLGRGLLQLTRCAS